MRVFESGATRDSDEGKIDYAGCLSPYAQRAFGEYMRAHQIQADGTRRDSRNWQKGIPMDAYISSAARHWHEVWEGYERCGAPSVEALCALMFNVQGMLHELTKPHALLEPAPSPAPPARCASQTLDGRMCRLSARHPGDCIPETPVPNHTGTAPAKTVFMCEVMAIDGRMCRLSSGHTGRHTWESF